MKKLQSVFFVMLWSVIFVGEASDLNRLFLTPEQRLLIESERQGFLDKTTYPEFQTEKKSLKKTASQVGKSNSLQIPLSVSAIIITPDGMQYIRLNDAYRKLPPGNKADKATAPRPFETHFKVKNRQVVIPVGKTYLPDSKKIIKNYQYNLRNKAGDVSPEKAK